MVPGIESRGNVADFRELRSPLSASLGKMLLVADKAGSTA